MADVNRGNRPLSPHLTIYKPQLNSMTSILSRITAVGMSLAIFLVVWWFLALSTNADYFAFADGLLNSWIGGLVMIGSLWALWYHTCSGIRHLYWDTGSGFELDQVDRSSYVVIGASVVLTVITLVVAF